MNPSALRPATRLTWLVVGEVAIAWSSTVLFPGAWYLWVSIIAILLAIELRQTRGQWHTRRIVADALREHRDPGQIHLGEVFSSARVAVAGGRLWVGPTVIGLYAAATIAVALARAQPLDLLPGLFLLGWAMSAAAVLRRADRLAQRWLTDPPAPDPAANVT